MPISGMMKISRIHPALPHPDRSLRRKMSAKTAMNIQINMNQKKKTINAHSTLPNVHSYASTYPSLSPVVGAPEPTLRRPSSHQPALRPSRTLLRPTRGRADVPDPGTARDRPGRGMGGPADRRPHPRPDRLDPGADRGVHRLVRGGTVREPD